MHPGVGRAGRQKVKGATSREHSDLGDFPTKAREANKQHKQQANDHAAIDGKLHVELGDM